MNWLTKIILALLATSLMSVCQASDGPGPTTSESNDIDFVGLLFQQTCTIAVDGVVTPAVATVTLPDVLVNLLDAAGKTAGRTDFDIKLTNCVGEANSARAFFEAGPGVEPISGELINHGSATNVRLRLLEGTTPISAGSSLQLETTTRIDFVSNAAVLHYAVEYIATSVATAGTVLGSVVYTIDYK